MRVPPHSMCPQRKSPTCQGQAPGLAVSPPATRVFGDSTKLFDRSPQTKKRIILSQRVILKVRSKGTTNTILVICVKDCTKFAASLLIFLLETIDHTCMSATNCHSRVHKAYSTKVIQLIPFDAYDSILLYRRGTACI